LDLDSDGDGCPDAKEASVTGTLTTGTVVNLTSPTGTATTATTGVANAIATGSYGANGFADALETTTESGNYSGIYNYDYAISKVLNACSDTDNDGITDLIDIDDDNDGILDAVESPTCFYNRDELAVPIDISTELLPYSTNLIDRALDGNAATASAFAPSQNWIGKVIFKYTAISQIPIASIDIDLVSWALSSDGNQKFKLQGSNDNSIWSDLSAAISSGLLVPNGSISSSKPDAIFDSSERTILSSLRVNSPFATRSGAAISGLEISSSLLIPLESPITASIVSTASSLVLVTPR
jgi:hypothetical protein